jgi:hypothetical protein
MLHYRRMDPHGPPWVEATITAHVSGHEIAELSLESLDLRDGPTAHQGQQLALPQPKSGRRDKEGPQTQQSCGQ